VAFPRKYLNEGEDVVLDLQPHWWVFSLPSLAVLLALVLAVIAWDTFLQIPLLVALLVAAGWAAVVYARWRSTEFVITTNRLIYREGMLSKRGVEIPLDRVNNVLFRQSLFERMLGAGDLIIESAGESGQQHFANIRKPNAVQNEIHRQADLYEQRRAARHSAPADSIPDQIAKLAELRDQGVISQTEFAEKKDELLRRL